MQPVILSATDRTVTVRFVDSTDFSAETGVTAATAGLALWYRKGATGSLTSVTAPTITTLAALTTAHTDWGIKHISDGYVRVDLPDAAVPTTETEVTVVGGAATGMIVLGTALTGDSGTTANAAAVWDRVLTGGTHNIASSAGRRLRGIQEFQGYEGGAVWIDTVSGTAGTTAYELLCAVAPRVPFAVTGT